MAGVDTILRLIGLVIGTISITIIGFFGVNLIDPIYAGLNFADMPSQWGSPQDVTYLFMTLGFIGLLGVIFIWWYVSPVRDDVRQDVQRQGPF